MAEARSAEARQLPEELRRRLDAEPLRAVAEYLGERLGCARDGAYTIELRIDQGNLRKTYLHRGPIGNVELEGIGERL